MVGTKMYIPKTIKVGYQTRNGTYTGKLAYVIYIDDKGVLRKEKSWQGWRDHKIQPEEFDNEPTSGFVLNKKVGGVSWSHWHRNTYVRVYDPRNFEFEISIPNLLFILQECSAIKGKGLEGEFVYAWEGTELILMPVTCDEYQECVKHTARQKIKFDKADLEEGHTYVMKDGVEGMYLGHHPYNNKQYRKPFNPVGRRHIFLVLNREDGYSDLYLAESGFTRLAERTSSSPSPQFPKEYDKFKKSVYCGDIKSVSVRKTPFSDKMTERTVLIKKGDKYYVADIGRYYGYGYGWRRNDMEYSMAVSAKPFVPEIKRGTIKLPSTINDRNNNRYSAQTMAKKEFYTVTVTNDKGKSIQV